MAGVIVFKSSSGRGAILRIPIKGSEPKELFTSIKTMIDFCKGKQNFFYFNPKEDFKDGGRAKED